MNIHDKAHELASALKNSEEFLEFKRLNSQVMKNEKHKEMIEDFRNKVMEYQLNNYGKEEQDSEELEKIQTLQNALMMNSELSQYLMAELRFSQLFEDINKIIVESIQLDEE